METDKYININHLSKTNKIISRRPDMTKYHLSFCKDKITDTTKSWLSIIKLLKINITDYDKSRVVLGYLKDYGEIVVKLGNSPDIEKEFKFSRVLIGLKGFVKYICAFHCNDDFLGKAPHICNGPGTSMQILLMPYFPLGSIAIYKWNHENIDILRTCLKHSVLSILVAFYKLNVIHGDFHAGNVLLKPTKSGYIKYDILGDEITVKTHGIRTWIMDFENMSVFSTGTQYDKIMAMNNFYIDLKNFFTLLCTTIKILDARSIVPVENFINKFLYISQYMSSMDVKHLLVLIDDIKVL
jgi:hypothetical protein